MATTTVRTPQNYSDNAAAMQQQAYQMSADWLQRTVAMGQDTGAKQAGTKSFYAAADRAQQFDYQRQSAKIDPYEEAVRFMSSQPARNQANTDDAASAYRQSALQNASASMAGARESAMNKDKYRHEADLQDKSFSQQLSLLNRQQSFDSQQNAEQRKLQAYLGNVDAQSRLATSIFGSQTPYDYKYW